MNREEMSCKRLWESLSDYIDGELSDELCQKIEQHMAGCEHCRIVVDTTNKTITLCHHEAQDTEMPADVRGRLFETLHIEDYLKPKST
jgi:anti-sigma factor (TIGR02949 family)